MRSCILVFLATLATATAMAQDEALVKRSRIMVGIGHMHVSQGLDATGDRRFLSLPMWVIDYDYSITPQWAIGLHNDFTTENFKVEGHKGTTEIERSRPVASMLSVSYKPGKHAVYNVGTGGEFSTSGNYFMFRLGFEYGFEIGEDWELAPGVVYDVKVNAYDSFSIALAVGRRF